MPNRFTIPASDMKELFSKRKNFLWNLYEHIDAKHSFCFYDWEILFYVCENYKPDQIFEVGRGEGNSTCVLMDYCFRHHNTSLLSLDLYDTWNWEVVQRLPSDIPKDFFKQELKKGDFLDFEIKKLMDRNWEKLLIFWDVNDEKVTQRFVHQLLPELRNRDFLVCMHDISHKTGRPKRYHWNEYESIYKDILVIGSFIDNEKWTAKVPDTIEIFGSYVNAGHWLMFLKNDKNW